MMIVVEFIYKTCIFNSIVFVQVIITWMNNLITLTWHVNFSGQAECDTPVSLNHHPFYVFEAFWCFLMHIIHQWMLLLLFQQLLSLIFLVLNSDLDLTVIAFGSTDLTDWKNRLNSVPMIMSDNDTDCIIVWPLTLKDLCSDTIPFLNDADFGIFGIFCYDSLRSLSN